MIKTVRQQSAHILCVQLIFLALSVGLFAPCAPSGVTLAWLMGALLPLAATVVCCLRAAPWTETLDAKSWLKRWHYTVFWRWCAAVVWLSLCFACFSVSLLWFWFAYACMVLLHALVAGLQERRLLGSMA